MPMPLFLPLARSRMCPSEASTAYCRPRNFLSVRVFAGLSTITRFLAMGPFKRRGAVANFWGAPCRGRANMRLRECHACQVPGPQPHQHPVEVAGLPLPWGEGWGEGDGINFKSSRTPTPDGGAPGRPTP